MSAWYSAVIKKANSVGNEEERNGEQRREQREVVVQLLKSVQIWFPALKKGRGSAGERSEKGDWDGQRYYGVGFPVKDD